MIIRHLARLLPAIVAAPTVATTVVVVVVVVRSERRTDGRFRKIRVSRDVNCENFERSRGISSFGRTTPAV